MAQRDLHLVRQEGNRIARESINGFFTQYPSLQEAFFYLKANGNLDGFGQRTNHEGITLDKTNESQMYDIFVEGEIMRGLTKEAAIKRADLFKKNDMLADEAERNLLFMVGREKEIKEADKTKFEAQQRQIEADRVKLVNDVKTKVTSGKIMDYIIPENIRVARPDGTIVYRTKEDFINYVTVQNKDGLTQAQLDARNETLDTKLLYDYLRFTYNNMSYIIEQRVKDNKVADFRTRFATSGIPAGKKTFVAKAGNASGGNNNDVKL